VSYGFDVDRTMVWLEPLRPEGPAAGRLCRRHADSLTLPRGWWLRDSRDEAALFPAPTTMPALYRPRRTRRRAPEKPPAGPAPAALVVVDAGTDDVTWWPAFDADSDVDGLLTARTPLLKRAFTGPPPARAAEG
jgi:hypothetical protein